MFKFPLRSAHSLNQGVSSQTLLNLDAYGFFESRRNRTLVIAIWFTASILISILMQKYSDNRNSDNIIESYSSFIANSQIAIPDEVMALPIVSTSKYANKKKDELSVSIPVKIPHQDNINSISSDSGRENIRGFIKNEAGLPLSSADVLLFRGDHWVGATYTIENGEFSFNTIASGCYNLKIIREGFAEMSIPEFYVSTNTILSEIRLEKLNVENANKKELVELIDKGRMPSLPE